MPLPGDTQPWPLPGWKAIQRDHEEAAAWYSGDPDKLKSFYGSGQSLARPSLASRLWRRSDAAGSILPRARVHVPIASDVAATSADLLFGEEPTVIIPDAHGEAPDSEAQTTEERMLFVLGEIGLADRLIEAAEVCAGIGGAYLRPAWDETVADHPLLSIVHADAALPEFRFGVLTAVTFWSEMATVTERTNEVWRLLERHEPGMVWHGLYIGTPDRLGVLVDLTAHPDAEHLDDVGEKSGKARVVNLTALGIDGLLVRHVPNALPNRKHRTRPIGRADTAGSEDMMDALDETMTSWMRDIRIGQARIIVPAEFLRRRGRGEGATFDVDQEVFSPIEMDPASAAAAGITPVEFKIRTEDHARTMETIVKQVIGSAGYSVQSFGIEGEGSAATATEIKAREGKSLRTRARKGRYWVPAIEEAVELLMVIDRAVFKPGVTPMRPRVELAEHATEDARQVAETVLMLRNAQAASIRTRVRMVNPDLEADEVEAEVAAIIKEEGIGQMPEDPTGGFA